MLQKTLDELVNFLTFLLVALGIHALIGEMVYDRFRFGMHYIQQIVELTISIAVTIYILSLLVRQFRPPGAAGAAWFLGALVVGVLIDFNVALLLLIVIMVAPWLWRRYSKHEAIEVWVQERITEHWYWAGLVVGFLLLAFALL